VAAFRAPQGRPEVRRHFPRKDIRLALAHESRTALAAESGAGLGRCATGSACQRRRTAGHPGHVVPPRIPRRINLALSTWPGRAESAHTFQAVLPRLANLRQDRRPVCALAHTHRLNSDQAKASSPLSNLPSQGPR
jgi:hypothetical protein